MDTPASALRIAPFIEKYGLDVTEFAAAPDTFRSFNDFFCRKLKPEARPVAAGPNAAALPADGRHLVFPDISKCRDFFIKGVRFNLPALLGSAGLAQRFERGGMLVSRLCPTDYHRFHFPCAGIPDMPRLINGPLYSVSPIALAQRPSILWENKRYITRLRSDRFGEVVLLEVGATCVGTVVHTAIPGQRVDKGDEKGYFRFGGSCFITLFEPGAVTFAPDLLEHSAAGREVYARFGDLAANAAS